MIQEQPRYEGREEYRRGETMTEREREIRDRGRFDEPEHYPGETEVREPPRRTEPYRSREHYSEPFTAQDTRVQTVYSASGINIVAGLWLILAPFALGYATIETAFWNSMLIGIAVGVMALVRVVRPTEYEGISWVNFVLGIWLIVSPFALNLMNHEPLVWNNIIVGVIVLALAATSAMATRRLHEPDRPTRRWST